MFTKWKLSFFFLMLGVFSMWLLWIHPLKSIFFWVWRVLLMWVLWIRSMPLTIKTTHGHITMRPYMVACLIVKDKKNANTQTWREIYTTLNIFLSTLVCWHFDHGIESIGQSRLWLYVSCSVSICTPGCFVWAGGIPVRRRMVATSDALHHERWQKAET